MSDIGLLEFHHTTNALWHGDPATTVGPIYLPSTFDKTRGRSS